jgi:chromatin modification-related protein EAF6
MSSTLATLQQRKERLDEELKQVEKQVYDLETAYLNDSSTHGNVLKGFEGFLSQTKKSLGLLYQQ